MKFDPRASDRVPTVRRGVDGLMSKPKRSSSPQRGVRRCNSLDDVLLGCGGSSHSNPRLSANFIFGETDDESSSVASNDETDHEDDMVEACRTQERSTFKKGDSTPQPPNRGNRPVVLRCNSLDNVLMEGSAHSIGRHKLSVEDIFGPSDDEADDIHADNSSISSKSALDLMGTQLKPRQRCNSMDDMLKEGSNHSGGHNLDANYIFSDQDYGSEFAEESTTNENSPKNHQALSSDQAPKKATRRVSNPSLVNLEGTDSDVPEDAEEDFLKASRDRREAARHLVQATTRTKHDNPNIPILKPRARAKLIPQGESLSGVLKRAEDPLSRSSITNAYISRLSKTTPVDQPPKLASRSESMNVLYMDDEDDMDDGEDEALWADRAPKPATRTSSSRPSLYDSDSDEENHHSGAAALKGLPPLPKPNLSRPPVFGDAPPKLTRRQHSDHDNL